MRDINLKLNLRISQYKQLDEFISFYLLTLLISEILMGFEMQFLFHQRVQILMELRVEGWTIVFYRRDDQINFVALPILLRVVKSS